MSVEPTGAMKTAPDNLSTPPISPIAAPVPVFPFTGPGYPYHPALAHPSIHSNPQLYYSILARQAVLANANATAANSPLASPMLQPPTSATRSASTSSSSCSSASGISPPLAPSGQLQRDFDHKRNRASRPPNITIQQHEMFPFGTFQSSHYSVPNTPNNLPMTPSYGSAFFDANGPPISPFPMPPFGGYAYQSPMVQHQPSPVHQDHQFVYPPPPTKAAVATVSSSPSSSPPAQSPEPPMPTREIGYWPNYCKGSMVGLFDGTLKRIEDMKTQDFILCAQSVPDTKLNRSKILAIKTCDKNNSILITFDTNGRAKQTVEAPFEHLFFVYDQGWAAYSPDRCKQIYGLDVRKLSVGDECISRDA